MCDVIKIRQMKEKRGEIGIETPKKTMDNRRIFMTSHMTLSSALETTNLIRNCHLPQSI